MNNKPFVYAVGLLVIVVGIVTLVLLVNNRPNPNPNPTACTQEAKICPDGSVVGRTLPNCEFAACPPLRNPGTLSGAATVGPICPVETETDPCEVPPQAYTSRGINIFNSQDLIVQTVNFDRDGRFSVQLNPGQYRVELIPNGIDSSSDLPKQITVQADQEVQLQINIDTGIR